MYIATSTPASSLHTTDTLSPMDSFSSLVRCSNSNFKTNSTSVMEGPLQRLSKSNYWLFRCRSWKRRFGRLQNDKLYLFEDQKCVRSSNYCEINLDHYDSCESLISADSITDDTCTKSGSRKQSANIFILFNSDDPKQRKHVFSALNENEMRNWIGALQSAIRRRRISGRCRSPTSNYPIVAEAELDAAAAAVEAPLQVVTKARPKAPPGRKLPARHRIQRAEASATNVLGSESNSQFGNSQLCGRSLNSIGSLSFRSGQCSHDSGLGVDTPTGALEERNCDSSIAQGQLSAMELAAKLSDELLVRTGRKNSDALCDDSNNTRESLGQPTTSRNPSHILLNKRKAIKDASQRIRSNSLDLLDQADQCNTSDSLKRISTRRRRQFGGSVDALDGTSHHQHLTSSPNTRLTAGGGSVDVLDGSNDSRTRCSCGEQCRSRRRFFFFLRSKHQCKSLSQLDSDDLENSSSTQDQTLQADESPTNEFFNDQNQSELPVFNLKPSCLKINRSKFYVKLLPECPVQCSNTTYTNGASLEDTQHLGEQPISSAGLIWAKPPLSPNSSSVKSVQISNNESSFKEQNFSKTQADSVTESIDSLVSSSNLTHQDNPEQSDFNQSDVLQDTQSISSPSSDNNNRQSFRTQFLQRKAMFETQGKKRHSIQDLLEQRLDANLELYQLESRPKSCGDTMESSSPTSTPLECNQ